MFVGSDTGPLHLAAAVDLPCVSLYGPSRPENCGPFGERHVVLQKYYQDGSCRERRRADNHALRAIQVSDVTAACDELLSRQSEQAA
jgi:ADP-heptose:LPS heptosyltransferase